MKFSSPLYLLLLFLVPVFTWIGWPSSGRTRRQEIASLVIRLLIVVFLVLSLAGMEIPRRGNELAVVFLVDVSDSMPQQAVDAEMDYLRSALGSMKADDKAAIVLFGADALVERPMLVQGELGAITSVPITNQTDLAEAIRMGLALFPSASARRMVILSDGAETTGNALAAAEFASALGVQIDVVPFANQTEAEALVTGIDAPTQLRRGERFSLNVSVQASKPMRAVVRVLAEDKILYEQTHALRRGFQTLSIPLVSGEAGFVGYQVQITPEEDSFYQNNRLDAFSKIEGPPRILMVAPPEGEMLPRGEARPDEFSNLLSALTSAGFDVTLVTPAHLPSDLTSLSQYDSIVLVDVPARTLGMGQQQSLQMYVRDLGGGLAAVGGPTSFGVGGYYDTPLEETLPVEMQIKDEKRRPTLTMVFIIDHSGSMGETSGGVMKLELAKEAVARSVELLFPSDHVGVIAFDDTASWVVPITDLSNLNSIIHSIGTIQVGGGTDIMAGLQAMAKVLPNDPSKVKHVILLTDGGADPTGIPQLVERLYKDDGITLSTVAVGKDAAPFLDDLALVGGGRFHFTTDANSIPSIFTEETTLATRAYIVEEAFFPKLVNSSPILAGIDSIPRLYGYVASSPKDLSRVILQSEKGDPILAVWQYGLGRSLAFTSDATGRWGKDWVQSKQFQIFWAQAIRYTIGDALKTPLEMTVKSEGERARLTVDAYTLGGGFLNGYLIQANVVAPNGEIQSVILRQVAPGRYETYFTPKEQGVYLIRFTGKSLDGTGSFSETMGWSLSYSPEYRNVESNPDLLFQLAGITGGKSESIAPTDVFSHNLKSARATRPIWHWLVLLAGLLLPLDIAIRRLVVTRHDWIRLRNALIKRSAPQPAQRTRQVDALFKAKRRVGRDNIPINMGQDSVSPKNISQIPTSANETIEEPRVEKQETSETESSQSTTASLLARKKSLRNKAGK